MFERNWDLCPSGSGGGDRKTLDCHMHFMEALTTLYECSGKKAHLKSLEEVIDILTNKMLHPVYKTGLPQFWIDWTIAPQIKFNIIWGWDRFSDGFAKSHPEDNTSYGHNVEFAWLLLYAADGLGQPRETYADVTRKIFDHTLEYGVNYEYGGVFVEGSSNAPTTITEKQFWQQAEVMIGMLEVIDNITTSTLMTCFLGRFFFGGKMRDSEFLILEVLENQESHMESGIIKRNLEVNLFISVDIR